MPSMLISDQGKPKHYMIVDNISKTILDAVDSMGGPSRAALNKFKDRKDMDVSIHNITHPKCPSWIIDILHADPEWCACKADDLDYEVARKRRHAEALRAEADEMIANAERMSVKADEFRNKHSSVQNAP